MNMNRKKVRISLACGCTLNQKWSPMNFRVTYPCPEDHGRRVQWTVWFDRSTKLSSVNPHARPVTD